MANQKMSIEDILKEYSSGTAGSSGVSENNSRLETEKLLNSAERTLSPPPSTEDILKEAQQLQSRQTLRRHDKPRISENPLRRPEPANEVKPADLARSTVAFADSEQMNRIRREQNARAAAYPGGLMNNQVDPDSTPKIRRMTDSTRAKEAEKFKKKRVKKGVVRSAYEKESPDGEYLYSPPKVKKKKRTRSVRQEAEAPENKRLITDIVPSPDAVEAARPVKPAPRAEKTSINLSEPQFYDEKSLDVHITQEAEEYAALKSKKKRTKRIVDFNYYGDVEDVGRDIFELKSIISVRVFILAMTSFLSLYITFAAQFNLPIVNILSKSNTISYLTTHLLIGLISIFSSMPVITNGLKKFFTFRSDDDSMTAITSLSCIAAIIPAFLATDMVKENTIHIYMPVGVLALLLNAAGKMFIMKRAARNFRFASRDYDRHGITYVHDETRAESLTRGTLGDFPILASMRKTDFLTDFLRYTYSSDMTDTYCRKASPLCFIFSAGMAFLLTYARLGTLTTVTSAAFGFSIFSMLICASSCIAMPLVVNVPLWRVSHQTIRKQGAILGYQSVDDFYDTNSILINADKLFPSGSVKLNGIKVFSNTKIDEALLQAASLTTHGGSIMKSLFDSVIAGRDGFLYPIENFSYEESMGLCGWINNRRVLFGNRELMISHSIEGIPTKTKEAEYASTGQEALYLSISGNLAAMFIVDIFADKDVKHWMKRLDKNKICLIIRSVDACLSLKRLSGLFGIPEEMMRILPKKLHEDADQETERTVRLSASMACSGKFSSMAQLIIGTKVIHSAAIIGLIFQTVSILLGLGLSMMLIMTKAFDYNYISASALIIYNLACTIVTCIAASMKKLK